MSINKLSHLKEGEKIYLEVTRDYGICDDKDSVRFKSNSDSSYLDDNDTFYTLEELKTLANDGMPNGNMPKQGEMIQVANDGEKWNNAIKGKFVCSYLGKVIIHNEGEGFYCYDNWRYPQKTELTLAEVEERLGLDAGSLIIK